MSRSDTVAAFTSLDAPSHVDLSELKTQNEIRPWSAGLHRRVPLGGVEEMYPEETYPRLAIFASFRASPFPCRWTVTTSAIENDPFRTARSLSGPGRSP